MRDATTTTTRAAIDQRSVLRSVSQKASHNCSRLTSAEFSEARGVNRSPRFEDSISRRDCKGFVIAIRQRLDDRVESAEAARSQLRVRRSHNRFPLAQGNARTTDVLLKYYPRKRDNQAAAPLPPGNPECLVYFSATRTTTTTSATR